MYSLVHATETRYPKHLEDEMAEMIILTSVKGDAIEVEFDKEKENCDECN